MQHTFFGPDLVSELMPKSYVLMPNVSDIFELEFALGEISALDDQELIRRSAYVRSVNGVESTHYKMGMAAALDVYESKSIRTRSFFSKGRFSTGYAVHSLFPYRGKFHAQLVKGIINVIGLKPGGTLLDPMMGSGTACHEAQLLGVNAIGVDISPFCCLMASAKSIAMTLDPDLLRRAIDNLEATERTLANHCGDNRVLETFGGYRSVVLLAYLDAMGYARRVKNQSTADKFGEVMQRYFHTIDSFARLRTQLALQVGSGSFCVGDARKLELEDQSVDGIVTSPPYSFAIDYVENDLPQLEYLGVDTHLLRENLIGLRGGRGKSERIRAYFGDLRLCLSEWARVLKPGGYAVIIIGSNEIQTGGIRHEVEVKSFAPEVGLALQKEMIKPIRGIQNSMTEEYVLFFRKGSTTRCQ